MEWEEDLREAVTLGGEVQAEELAKKALASGASPSDILQKGAVAGIYEAGRRWHAQEFFLPDIILASEAFNAVMRVVEPALEKEPAGVAKGKVVIGSIEGDAHDLGKNIVAVILRSSLYEVFDLGVDVTPDRFVEAARERGADVVGIGAYMTTTMRNMPSVIEALEAAGLRQKVKVVVGGAAVTEDYARQIGADGYGPDAYAAVSLLDRLLGVG